jgi:hypothetical protein
MPWHAAGACPSPSRWGWLAHERQPHHHFAWTSGVPPGARTAWGRELVRRRRLGRTARGLGCARARVVPGVAEAWMVIPPDVLLCPPDRVGQAASAGRDNPVRSRPAPPLMAPAPRAAACRRSGPQAAAPASQRASRGISASSKAGSGRSRRERGATYHSPPCQRLASGPRRPPRPQDPPPARHHRPLPRACPCAPGGWARWAGRRLHSSRTLQLGPGRPGGCSAIIISCQPGKSAAPHRAAHRHPLLIRRPTYGARPAAAAPDREAP